VSRESLPRAVASVFPRRQPRFGRTCGGLDGCPRSRTAIPVAKQALANGQGRSDIGDKPVPGGCFGPGALAAASPCPPSPLPSVTRGWAKDLTRQLAAKAVRLHRDAFRTRP